MIIDALELPAGTELQADVCIVGSGAAGIALALPFADGRHEVIVIEAGGARHEPETQALYAGEVADTRLHPPLDRYRERRYGGSTTTWGGRCVPFDPIDFEVRDYVPHSGWPIGHETLQPYYARATQLCEAGECAFDAASAFPRGLPPLLAGFDSASFSTDTLERFSCPTDFGRRYRQRLDAAANLRVLLHANVTGVELGDDGRAVSAVRAASLGGKTLRVRARCVILAAGGLENARLLLASDEVQRTGIGNAHDLVGRYYMCHLAGTTGTLALEPGVAVRYGYDVSDDGIYCRRRFALRADAQRRLGVGNFIARLHHPRITDPAHGSGALSLLYLAKPFIPYEYAKRLHGDDAHGIGRWLAHLGNLVRDPLQAFAFAWQMLTQRKLAERKFPSIIIEPRRPRFSLDFHAEQLPNPDSRVTLGSERDALGMRRLHLDWRYRREDVETVARALATFAADVRASGIGRYDYDPDAIEAEMLRYGAYGGHHIGTARMGRSPREGVVDTNLQVHGVDNLFVAGAAVFPTSSQANPTLTIVALSLRLAGHLQARLAAGTPLAAAPLRELAA